MPKNEARSSRGRSRPSVESPTEMLPGAPAPALAAAKLLCAVCGSEHLSTDLDRMMSHAWTASGSTIKQMRETGSPADTSEATLHRLLSGDGVWNDGRKAWACRFIGEQTGLPSAAVQAYLSQHFHLLTPSEMSRLRELACCCPIELSRVASLGPYLLAEFVEFACSTEERLFYGSTIPFELQPSKVGCQVVANWKARFGMSPNVADAVENVAVQFRRAFSQGQDVRPPLRATLIVPESAIFDLIRRDGWYRGIDPTDARNTIRSVAFDAVESRYTRVVPIPEIALKDAFGAEATARIAGQWIFGGGHRLLRWTTRAPILLFVDGGRSEAQLRFVRDEVDRTRNLLNHAGFDATREACFELLMRHYIQVK